MDFKCIKCDIIKDSSKFSKSKYIKRGFVATCKDCCNKNSRNKWKTSKVREKRIQIRKEKNKYVLNNSYCRFCKKIYLRYDSKQKYCSELCSSQAQKYNNRKIYIKGCPECNILFTTTQTKKIYCCRKCMSKYTSRIKYYEGGKREKDLERLKAKYKEPEYNKKRRHYEKYLRPNSEKRKKSHLSYEKEKYHSDEFWRLKYTIRRRLNLFFKAKDWKKGTKTFEMVGCSPEELKIYIESKFLIGMNWKNYGWGWHIDHIVPLSCAKTKEEAIKLCNYTNLQPLWAKDNLIKSNKIT